MKDDHKPPHPPVAIPERVYGLELVVGQGTPHDLRLGPGGVYVPLQVVH